jgi:hypothetical protein
MSRKLPRAWRPGLLFSVCCGLACLGGCSDSVVAPSVPEVGDAADIPGGRLLLYPVAEPTRMLGHAVMRGADGTFTIADDLAPGCEVRPRREPSRVTLRREVEMREATDLAAGYKGVASFEARWGKGLQVRVEAQNEEIVRAELTGPCGEEVVSELLIGTGARFVERKADVGAGVDVGVAGVQAGGGSERSARVLDEMRWTEAQAYAFRTRAMGSTAALEVEVRMPPQIVEGESVELVVTTNEPASLIVYYVGSDGQGDQILPCNEEPHPRTEAGKDFLIPTAGQKQAGVRFEAHLPKPGEPVKEQLVVYAFREDGDARALVGALDEAGGSAQKLEQVLTERLASLPAKRFRKRIVTYTIEPRR